MRQEIHGYSMDLCGVDRFRDYAKKCGLQSSVHSRVIDESTFDRPVFVQVQGDESAIKQFQSKIKSSESLHS